jgi:diguanylate cyclase (GGDEF)-like protein/PAS domain S-box-containing protein
VIPSSMDSKSILIVEDESIIAADIRRTVLKLGYSVVDIIHSGEEAVARVSELNPDLVLMDILLQGKMDGIQAAEIIHNQHDIPVIFITAFADESILERARLSHPFGYVLKPFKDKELHNIIEMALYQHSAEHRLRESEERYRLLVESSPEPIMVHSDMRVAYANPACLRFIGAEKLEDLIGKPVLDLLAPEYHAVVRDRIRKSYLEKVPALPLMEKYIRLDGKPVYAEVSSAPTVYQEKNATQVVLRDVTQRLLAEEALKESELKFRSIVEQSLDGIALSDENGLIIEWNPAEETITGIPRADALGKDSVDLMLHLLPNQPPDRIERIKNKMTNLLANNTKTFWFDDFSEQLIQRADGTLRTIHIQIFPIRLGERILTCAINRDITSSKLASEALEEANRQLKQWVVELELRSQKDLLLSEMGELLQSCRNIQEAYAVINQFTAPLFSGQAGMLLVINPVRNILESISVWGAAESDTEFTPAECWGLRRMRPYTISEPASQLICRHVKDFRERYAPANEYRPLERYFCIPMTAQGETLGLLHLEITSDQPLERWQQLAITAADRIGLALANLKLRESLRTQATRDSLSGIFNRQYLEETLDMELQRAFHTDAPLSLAMLRIEHYSEIIEEYGYSMGDTLLREVGIFLQSNTLPAEVSGRYGGEDFMILFPRTTPKVVKERVQKILELSSALRIQHRGQILGQMEISAGISNFPQNGTTSWDLIKTARELLNRTRNNQE